MSHLTFAWSFLFQNAMIFLNSLKKTFFTSGDLDDCELICKTPQKYEEFSEKGSDRIIMKVARQTSSLELTLSTMTPLYVSQNPTQGAQECSLIFNEKFNATQDN